MSRQAHFAGHATRNKKSLVRGKTGWACVVAVKAPAGAAAVGRDRIPGSVAPAATQGSPLPPAITAAPVVGAPPRTIRREPFQHATQSGKDGEKRRWHTLHGSHDNRGSGRRLVRAQTRLSTSPGAQGVLVGSSGAGWSTAEAAIATCGCFVVGGGGERRNAAASSATPSFISLSNVWRPS